MVALRKDVKVGLTIGAIVVAVVGVYAGLSALAGGGSKPANGDSTASLQTTPPAGVNANNTNNKGTSGIADRTARSTDKAASADGAKSPPPLIALGGSGIGGGTPAIANPDAPVAAGNRKPGEDPWQNAFSSGHIEPAVTVTPDPAKPAGTGTAADRSDIIKSMTGAGPSTPDTGKTTASTNEPSGTVAGGAAQPTLTKAGDQTHVIVPGETFNAIAAEYYGDAKYVKLILDANPSVNPNKLKPGTAIRIPLLAKKDAASDKAESPTTGAAPTAKIDPAKQYVIKPGDNLHKIASELYGDIAYADKLYAANKALIGADPAKLKVGTVLSLPEAPKKK